MMYTIYCITNKINNKSYVGLTNNVTYRWDSHIKNAKYKYKRYAFQNAILKYGVGGFDWQVIEEFNSLSEAEDAEEFYIYYLQTMVPNGYNVKPGGRCAKLTAASKEKIRAKLKIVGNFVGKKGADHPNFGRKLSAAHKEKISKINSSDNAGNAKLTKEQVINIYQSYLNNPKKSAVDLSIEYNCSKNTICNILNKKSWKAETANFPDVDLSNRIMGDNCKQSKLNEKTVRNIKQDIIDMKNNNEIKISKKLSIKYNITQCNINGILYNKTWKHIII